MRALFNDLDLTVLRSLMAIGSQPVGFDYADLRLVQPLPPPEYFAERSSARAMATRAAYDQLKARFGDDVAANVGYPTGASAGVVTAVGASDGLLSRYSALS